MSDDWEPTERRPGPPMDDAGSDLPPTEAIPGQGGPPEEIPIVPMSDDEPPPPPPVEPVEPVGPAEPVEPAAYEPTMVVPPTGPPPGGPPLTPGPPPPRGVNPTNTFQIWVDCAGAGTLRCAPEPDWGAGPWPHLGPP